MPIEYLFLTLLSSVWLWVFLATIWIFLSNNIFGVPYGAWLKAKDNENELSELHQITLFLASLFTKKYHITTHWFLNEYRSLLRELF